MGISVWQLLIVLLIVALLFGTKRLRTVGSDLGGAIRSFRRETNEGESPFQSEVVRLNKRERG
ncbi:sec-independent protein translocase protein TatA [Modicisalibacter xianhensis]|uniref:Sec-independent protein translocase protein TatA n=1 Tax=Modicisalibacter xianhensis TaxID=442341 RepID=A0A4R8FYX4_9GAMM|nr:sec-independent protein translocase protein TatA [Halomonas xianhensis]